jgi:hypothetical protein
VIFAEKFPSINQDIPERKRGVYFQLSGAPSFRGALLLPLPPRDLTPPYWINMGAMAISTLAGVRLVEEAHRMPLLGEVAPFIKGMTLLF